MKLIKFLSILIVSLAFNFVSAQDDLLNQLDSVQTNQKQIESATFKGLQICNIQSTKLPVKGEFYFLVSHRFGDLSNGFQNFFGLDNALTKISGIYGVTNWLTLGISRHTFNKTYEFSAKYKLSNQQIDGFPFTIVGYNTMDINSDLKKATSPDLQFTNRLAYTTQLLVSRKFSEKFSLELAPIYVHKNLYDAILDQKDLFLMGAGARYKLSRRISLNVDYAARLNLPEDFNSPYHNPLTFGLDIETGGHIFQLVFSNSQAMNDVSYFSNATGKWFDRGMFFGFNMYRVF